MTNKAGQTNSVEVEEHMIFWIDDAAKTFILSDGRRLRISRFDKSWIVQVVTISSTSSIGPTDFQLPTIPDAFEGYFWR